MEDMLLKAVLGVVGWIAVRHEFISSKVSKLETKLENGIAHAVDRMEKDLGELKREVESHIDGEETRIMEALRRDPRSRSRKGDRKSFED